MKFTFDWLKDHMDTQAGLDEIVSKLSMIGLEVEGVEDRAKALAPFRVAHVTEAKPHPNADRLRVCQVDTGEGIVQVVCGAPNARTGMKGVFAPAGSYIPGTDMVLKPGEIRGQMSNGMLVSEREMGLSDEHEGIIEAPAEAKIGTPFAQIAGLDDAVIEVGVTPNRGDCLGVRGIARDLAAAGLGRLKPADFSAVKGSFDSPLKWRRALPKGLEVACPFVAGRYFRKLKNGPSPAWMQRRLRAIGLRPISALVDITNYVTYDLNRPLHVFDAAKVKGDPTMRMAKAGETILALDGESYELTPEMVVIADENGPEGIGGVMGGELSGVSETTTEVFLEVALFDPLRTATTGRRLGILSDARYRFERGLDPESAIWGAEAAARLILEFCGGEASHVVSAGDLPPAPAAIELRPARVAALGGIEVPAAVQTRILGDLGFKVAKGKTLRVTPPGWRPDIEGEACLVEEVLRIHGFDKIPVVPLARQSDLPPAAIDRAQKRVSHARAALAWRGLDEAVTFSFVSGRQAARFGGGHAALSLDNPISAELDVMRPSVLPGLAAAAARNADRGLADVAIFEIGPQYADASPKGQARVAAGLRAGPTGPRHWAAPARPVDALDAKADALAVLEACGAPVENLQTTRDAPAWYHPGRSAVLRLGPNVLAQFGALHPQVLEDFGLRGPAVAFEVFLDRVPLPRAKDGKLKPPPELSPFQAVERDFAFVVEDSVPAETLIRAAKGADKALISKVDLFDVYTGKGVDPGQKSLAIAVTLQPKDRTLTDPEIEAAAAKIVAAVAKATGGVLRG